MTEEWPAQARAALRLAIEAIPPLPDPQSGDPVLRRRVWRVCDLQVWSHTEEEEKTHPRPKCPVLVLTRTRLELRRLHQQWGSQNVDSGDLLWLVGAQPRNVAAMLRVLGDVRRWRLARIEGIARAREHLLAAQRRSVDAVRSALAEQRLAATP